MSFIKLNIDDKPIYINPKKLISISKNNDFRLPYNASLLFNNMWTRVNESPVEVVDIIYSDPFNDLNFTTLFRTNKIPKSDPYFLNIDHIEAIKPFREHVGCFTLVSGIWFSWEDSYEYVLSEIKKLK